MHETISLVLPNLRFGSSFDFKTDTLLSGTAATPVTEGSIAAVVVIAAVCKNFRLVKCVLIKFLFCSFFLYISGKLSDLDNRLWYLIDHIKQELNPCCLDMSSAVL